MRILAVILIIILDKGMVRVKASLILLFLIVPIVRSSQVSTKNVCIFSGKIDLHEKNIRIARNVDQ